MVGRGRFNRFYEEIPKPFFDSPPHSPSNALIVLDEEPALPTKAQSPSQLKIKQQPEKEEPITFSHLLEVVIPPQSSQVKAVLVEQQIEDALNSLSHCRQPESVVGREQEQLHIKEYIEGGIEGCGRVQPLVICGVPGVGKTTALLDICKRLRSLHEFDFVCLSLARSESEEFVYKKILKVLLQGITGYRRPRKKEVLDHIFTYGQLMAYEGKWQGELSLHVPMLLVLEEVDMYVKSERQDLLYNLLEWCQRPHSNLIIVMVSNRMDIGRLFNERVQSRLGRNQLVFTPYPDSKMTKIIESRLGHLPQIFSHGTLKYAVRKMLVRTTDVRQHFRVLQECLRLIRPSAARGNYFITPDIVNCAYKRHMADPITIMLSGLPECTKVVILSALLLLKKREKEECTSDELLIQARPFCAKIQSSCAINHQLSLLQAMGLFTLKKARINSQTTYRFELLMPSEQVIESMESDDPNLRGLFRLLEANKDQ